MFRSLKNVCHSFINTLLFLWTLILAPFVRKGRSSSFPSDQLTLVPYPTNLDLENGLGRMRVGDMGIGDRAFRPEDPIAYANLMRKALMEDARCQKCLRDSEAFVSPPQTPHGVDNAYPSSGAGGPNGSASGGPIGAPPLSPDDCTDESADISSAYSHYTSGPVQEHSISDILAATAPILASANSSPCLDVFTETPRKLSTFKFGGYPLSSTPPKTPKNGRGHRRAALATITNIAHVAGFFSPPNARSPSPTKFGSIPGAPVAQRTRSQSLRRKPAFDDLHSPSPLRRYSQASLGEYGSGCSSSPTKRPVSIVWFSDKNGIPFKSVSPLRIIKRNLPPQPDAQPKNVPAQVAEENLRDMVAAVRSLREDEGEDGDEGDAARELINRASVWTCKTAVTMDSTRNILHTVDQGDETETDEEEYGDQATCRSTCSPPPPYAFSHPGLHHQHHLTEIDEKEKVPEAGGTSSLEALPPSESTELSYLQGGTPPSSMGSSLDDILTSFEGMISALGPRTPGPRTPTHGGTKAELALGKGVPCDVRESRAHPYGGVADEDGAGPHWSEVLMLEGYAA